MISSSISRSGQPRNKNLGRQREKEKRASTPEKEPKAAKAFVMRVGASKGQLKHALGAPWTLNTRVLNPKERTFKKVCGF